MSLGPGYMRSHNRAKVQNWQNKPDMVKQPGHDKLCEGNEDYFLKKNMLNWTLFAWLLYYKGECESNYSITIYDIYIHDAAFMIIEV